jgi:hypothetical protein
LLAQHAATKDWRKLHNEKLRIPTGHLLLLALLHKNMSCQEQEKALGKFKT